MVAWCQREDPLSVSVCADAPVCCLGSWIRDPGYMSYESTPPPYSARMPQEPPQYAQSISGIKKATHDVRNTLLKRFLM